MFARLRSTTLEAEKVGLVKILGSGSLLKTKSILDAMQIPVKLIADLDFAFQHAESAGLLASCTGDLTKARGVFGRLADADEDIQLRPDGLPEGKKGGLWAADVYALFAEDGEGKAITQRLHDALLKHGVWLWKKGAIEHHLGLPGKGEGAWMEFLEMLEDHGPGKAITDVDEFRRLVDWVVRT